MNNFSLFFRSVILLLLLSIAPVALFFSFAETSGADEPLGPQSQRALGEQRLLIVAVRFPDAEPDISLQEIKKKAVTGLDSYVREQSYGQAWNTPDFRGWVMLPDSLAQYKVSPDNFQVDSRRVRKLIEDTMTAIEKDVDFSRYQNMLIMPGVATLPGKGYGMMCYCANPGMLTGVRGNPGFAALKSKTGREFSGGVFVGTVNAPLGMLAHDYFHALGGVQENRRLVPCLYNFARQAEASRRHEWEYCTDYMGPWDVMSAHYVQQHAPPPGLSSFTRIRLGWIGGGQVKLVRPGESAYVSLSPLEKNGETLAIKIPLEDGRYYLFENRQPLGYDHVLPDSGLLALKVNPDAMEGAGTVTIMDANPDARNFAEATFKLNREGRHLFLDRANDLAVIPLWPEGEKLGVLVTSMEKSDEALQIALRIQALLAKGMGRDRSLQGCIESFRNLDFISCRAKLDQM